MVATQVAYLVATSVYCPFVAPDLLPRFTT